MSGCRGAVVGLCLLAASACGGDDPDADLRAAVADTLDDAFEIEVEVVEAGPAPVGVEVAGLLDGAVVRGARDDAGEVALAYDIGASGPLFEIRTAPGADPLLRLGMADLLGIGEDADPEAAVGPVLDARGVTGERRAAMLAGFVGDWIALEDERALGALAPGGAGEPDPTEADAGATDWLDAVRVERVTGDDPVRTYEVRVDLPALRGALAARLGSPLLGAQVPEDAPGRIDVVDGRVRSVEVDLGADDPGTDAVLHVRFDGHGAATVPVRPVPVARVSTADLAALVELLAPPA